MKTKYKYIHFVPGADQTVWTIWNHKTDDYLGILEFKKRWKEWELAPEPNTGWTTQCLLDVADFIKQLPIAKSGRVQAQVSGIYYDKNGVEITDGCTIYNEWDRDKYHKIVKNENGELCFAIDMTPLDKRYATDRFWEVVNSR